MTNYLRGSLMASNDCHDAGFGRLDCRASEVRIEDRRVDVRLAADRFRVAEPDGHRFDGADDVTPGLRLRRGAADAGERAGGEHRSGPRPEIFRGEVLAGDFPD